MNLVWHLLIVQGLLGAFDTLYHHELTVALPHQKSAQMELSIHAIRSVLYAFVFAGIAWFAWHGVWAWVLAMVIAVEIGLTLWDFCVEDRSRLLPASERITHTILAINGGAVFALLAYVTQDWWAQPSALLVNTPSWEAGVLSVFAAGVLVSGIRDACAAKALAAPVPSSFSLDFGEAPQCILITGGTGFIGQSLCRRLIEQGHHVIVLARNPVKATYLLGGNLRVISSLSQLDGRTPVNVVVNLAGESIAGGRWHAARKQKLLASRLHTTQAVFDWVQQAMHRPEVWINASAIGYYGTETPTPCHENSPAGKDFASLLCQEWEACATQAESLGIRTVILRFGVVWEKTGGALPKMLLPFYVGMGGRIGSGAQMMSWIHLDDLLRIIAFTRKNTACHGVYNATAPQPLSQADFAQLAGQVLHRPSLVPTPAWVFKVLFGEMATLFVDGQTVIPARLEATGFRFQYPAARAALRAIFP